MRAAVRAGFRVVEFTTNTPDAMGLIAEFSRDESLVVGAGTVLTVDQARTAVEAGARFLVSPVVDLEVIAEARRLGVASMPGTYSPTEMWQAHRAGAELQKLFPVTAAGPVHVSSVLGPMPFLRIVPTNGVEVDNVAAYLEAGAFAVGCVSALFSGGDMAAQAYDRIEARAAELLEAAGRAERPDTRPR
jgi:2-dehydro-3-deoxyphosphogluconate aldolase/(4S)-4-hydroxy-2-oxoglutarate aldolase